MNLNEEKQKVKYEHSLNVWRIILEKALLGVVIAGIAYVGNLYIEEHKSSLTHQRFMLECRLDGLKAIRSGYSDLSRNMIMLMKNPADEAILKTYQELYYKFNEVANEWNMLFSEKFVDSVQYHSWFHHAVASGSVTLSGDHYAFAFDVFNHFDDLTRKALWEETLGISKDVSISVFSFVEYTPEKMKKKGAKQFFEENYNKWLQDSKK